MIWLAWHMWALLLIMFALGVFFGWWLFGHHPRHRHHDAPAGEASGPDPDHDTVPAADPSVPTMALPANGVTRPEPTPVRPILYETPERGRPDNLQKISGVGPKYERLLNDLGIYYYDQIISWSDGEIVWLDNRLGFPGRIRRDRWQEQARLLMLGAGLGAGSSAGDRL